MTKKELNTRIRLAAKAFATGSTADEIATLCNVSERTIYRWASTDTWTAELDKIGFTGNRKLRTNEFRKPIGEQYEQVKELYHDMTDVPEHKRLRILEEQTGIRYGRLAEWRRRWEGRHKQR